MAPLVIGLGSTHRGDDAAGLEVARRLADRGAVAHGGDPLAIIELMRGADEVVLVDAMRSGESPGTTTSFDVGASSLPQASFVSSHAMGVAEAVELARSLGLLPERVRVIGIEAATLEIGAAMSLPVAAAVERLVKELADA